MDYISEYIQFAQCPRCRLGFDKRKFIEMGQYESALKILQNNYKMVPGQSDDWWYLCPRCETRLNISF